MLEALYKVDLIEKKPYLALILGIAYTVIGTGLAAWLFKSDPAIPSVAIISLLLYPTIKGLINKENALLKKQKKINKKAFLKNGKLMLIYLFIFLGVLIGFSLFSVILTPLATNQIFENQINVLYSSVGQASVLNSSLFSKLFTHNLIVLMLAFITALLVGDGAIFLLVWNASVWGTIFGNLAKSSAIAGSLNPFLVFGIILVIVLPHTLMEALSYITSAISGGVFSKTFISEKNKPKKRMALLKNASMLLITAIVILFIAVFIEQYVLIHSELYREIISLSGLLK